MKIRAKELWGEGGGRRDGKISDDGWRKRDKSGETVKEVNKVERVNRMSVLVGTEIEEKG